MAEGDTKKKLTSQILPAIIIALLVGGSAPWWWTELKGLFGPSDPPSSIPGKSAAGSGQAGPTQDTGRQAETHSSDFPGGSRRLYSAVFSKWPVNSNEHGTARPAQGKYLLEPNASAWIGPGSYAGLSPIDGDVVFDVKLTVQSRNPSAAFTFQIAGSGSDADYVEAFISVWGARHATYSLATGWLKDDFYLTRDKTIASRAPIPERALTEPWTSTTKLTLKRAGGSMEFFVNDIFLAEFAVSLFSISRISIGAAFESSISVKSIEARGRT